TCFCHPPLVYLVSCSSRVLPLPSFHHFPPPFSCILFALSLHDALPIYHCFWFFRCVYRIYIHGTNDPNLFRIWRHRDYRRIIFLRTRSCYRKFCLWQNTRKSINRKTYGNIRGFSYSPVTVYIFTQGFYFDTRG